jgi:drug/metabolite transporter (DMT)-like permease
VLFWPLVALRRERAPRRMLTGAFLMGLVGYSSQAAMFFLALDRIGTSLTVLLLYAYPPMVTGIAIALGRERLSRALVGALAVAVAGLLLLLGDGIGGGADLLGVGFGLASAVAYSAYILVGDSIVRGTPPLLLSALVTTGASISYGTVGLATGRLDVGVDGTAWVSMVGIAVLATFVPVSTFLAGLERVGASTASIVSTLEPAVAVALAALVLGDDVNATQLAGGGLLVIAIVLCQRARRAPPTSGPAAAPAGS